MDTSNPLFSQVAIFARCLEEMNYEDLEPTAVAQIGMGRRSMATPNAAPS